MERQPDGNWRLERDGQQIDISGGRMRLLGLSTVSATLFFISGIVVLFIGDLKLANALLGISISMNILGDYFLKRSLNFFKAALVVIFVIISV